MPPAAALQRLRLPSHDGIIEGLSRTHSDWKTECSTCDGHGSNVDGAISCNAHVLFQSVGCLPRVLWQSARLTIPPVVVRARTAVGKDATELKTHVSGHAARADAGNSIPV